jgi:hypothetical protein
MAKRSEMKLGGTERAMTSALRWSDLPVKWPHVCDEYRVDNFSNEWSEGAHESAREARNAGKSSNAEKMSVSGL